MGKLLKNKKGFTLVELMLVLALLAVVMIPLSSFFLSNYKYLYKANRQIEAQESAEKAIRNVSDALLGAKKAVDRSYVDSNPALGLQRIALELMSGEYVILEYLDSDSDGKRDAICVEKSGDINDIIDASDISSTLKASNITYFNIAFKPDDADIQKSNLAMLTITAEDNETGQNHDSFTAKSEVYLRNFGR